MDLKKPILRRQSTICSPTITVISEFRKYTVILECHILKEFKFENEKQKQIEKVKVLNYINAII
jgi:hypothetical protein